MNTIRPSVLTLFALGLTLGACSAPNATDPVVETRTDAAPIGMVQPAALVSDVRVSLVGDLYLAGQPAPEDFEALRDAGVRTIVDLRREGELATFDEPALVAELGLEHVRVPFGSPDQLTDEVFDRTRELLREAQPPIVLHCGSANRVGAVWIPWRVLDQGVPLEQAVEEAKRVGLRAEALEAKAREYVRRHDG